MQNSFLVNYTSKSLEAYEDDDLTGFDGVDSLLKDKEIAFVLEGINNSFESLKLINKYTAVIKNNPELSKVSTEMIKISMDSIYTRYNVPKLAIESYSSENISVESISEIANAIWEAITKAFNYIWNKLKQLYAFITNSEKKRKNEAFIKETEEIIKKAEGDHGSKVNHEDIPFIPEEAQRILSRLANSKGIVDHDRLGSLMDDTSAYLSGLKDIGESTNQAVYGIDTTLKGLKLDLSVNGTKTDISKYAQEVYNYISSKIDVSITANNLEFNLDIKKDLIDIYGGNETSDEVIEEISKNKEKIVDVRESRTLADKMKIYYILYEGNFSNYVPYVMLYLREGPEFEIKSKYLQLLDLASVLGNYKKLSSEIDDVIKNLNILRVSLQKSITDIIEKLSVSRKSISSEIVGADTNSINDMFDAILIMLKKISKFILEVFAHAISAPYTVLSSIAKLIAFHNAYYNTTIE